MDLSSTGNAATSTPNTTSVNWKVAGRAGEGIDVTGLMFGKLCLRHGMNVFAYREYPSLIRGGHNTHQVHASFEPMTTQQHHIDVLIAFNEEGITQHVSEIDATSVVLCDAGHDGYDMKQYASKTGATFIDFPMTNLSREATGHFLSQNIVALAASAWLLGMSRDILEKVINDQFGRKSPELAADNLKAMQAGYTYIEAHAKQMRPPQQVRENKQILLTGNHAVAMGAIACGVQYFSAYPMTPTSEILSTLASQQKNYPLVVKHVEDEISAVNQAIGASYAGVRAMTASATGGFALMVEGVSLAGVTEVPLVICVGQRPGPATGLPTWTCQSDLEFVIHAGHGEVPKVVLTPGDVKEHFELTKVAFDLAEKYHLVVFVLSDKYALESYASMPAPNAVAANQRFSFAPDNLPADDSYRRFVVTDEGFSPRSIPGQPHGLNVTNSYEHDEFGYATEDAALTKAMNEKRQRKMKSVAAALPQPVLVGEPGAATTLVGWGSTRLVLDEVIRRSNGTMNYIHIPCAWPFPVAKFTELARAAKKLIMVEGNATGQMQQLIRQQTGIEMAGYMHRYDGRPFYAEELFTDLQKMS